MERGGDAKLDPSTHYVRVTTKLVDTQNKLGLFVHLAVAASVLPDLRRAGIALGLFALVPFNIIASRTLTARIGPLAVELLRTTVNSVYGCFICHLAGWPPIAFVWLPFAALATDGSRRDVAWGGLVLNAALIVGSSVLGGVPWPTPVAFAVLAILCRVFTDQRVSLAHNLWRSSEASREELKREVAAREKAELELRQAQKLEAIGRLASGIAHEINNPLQFVDNGAEYAVEAFADLVAMVGRRHTWSDEEASLREDLTESLETMHGGVQRVTAIVRAMKDFAHPDQIEAVPTDLNRSIEATLVVARSEYATIADVKTELGALPPVLCHPGAIAQVIANVLVNAAHAIDARPDRKERGTIAIRSSVDEDMAVISVSDDGVGIEHDVRDRIFEPFFTTKAVGRGTGQGLATARAIVERHHGQIGFTTELGRGTTFTFRLPLTHRVAQAA